MSPHCAMKHSTMLPVAEASDAPHPRKERNPKIRRLGLFRMGPRGSLDLGPPRPTSWGSFSSPINV
eukprot:335121-Pyramimonas_sp.AAC.1